MLSEQLWWKWICIACNWKVVLLILVWSYSGRNYCRSVLSITATARAPEVLRTMGCRESCVSYFFWIVLIQRTKIVVSAIKPYEGGCGWGWRFWRRSYGCSSCSVYRRGMVGTEDVVDGWTLKDIPSTDCIKACSIVHNLYVFLSMGGVWTIRASRLAWEALLTSHVWWRQKKLHIAPRGWLSPEVQSCSDIY